MADINNITISGRIGTKPDIKYFETGAVKCKLSIGVNRWNKAQKKEEVTWFNAIAWGSKAEFLTEYANQGDMVFISGSLQKDTYKDTNGNDCSAVYILINEIKIATKKEKSA